MSMVRSSAVSLVIWLSTGCGTTTPAAMPVAAWAQRNPEAAHQLANWSRSNIKATRLFLKWESSEPIAFRDFLLWTARHPTQDLSAFAGSHPQDALMDDIISRRPWGAQAFAVWCHRYPGAAEELAS